MALNRDRTFFAADGYGFVTQDSDGLALSQSTNTIQLNPRPPSIHAGSFVAPLPALSRGGLYFYDDFIAPQFAATGGRNWTVVTTGAGAVSVPNDDTNQGAAVMGTLQLATSSAAGNGATIRLGDGNPRHRLRDWRVIDMAFLWYASGGSNGSGLNRFFVEMGMRNTASTRGVTMYYVADGGVNAVQARTNNGVVSDTPTTAVRPTAVAGGTSPPQLWRIIYEQDDNVGTNARVSYYVNDTFLVTKLTNLPTGATDNMFFFVQIEGQAGAGSEQIRIDAFSVAAYGPRY